MVLSFAFDRASVVMALALSACAWGSYRVVHRTPEGGDVALLGSAEDTARRKAEAFMASACPRGYVIVEESEAAAADETDTDAAATTDLLGHKKQTSASFANEDRRESRLKYRCKP